MAYQRFKLQDCLATLATTATLHGAKPQSVATIAAVQAENLRLAPETVADVATVATGLDENAVGIPGLLPTDTAIALERAASRARSTGCLPDEVLGRALAIVRADLRNAPALFIRQADLNRCHVCGEPEGEQLFVAVLSAMPDRPHWLHPSCHAEHVRRLDARVDFVMSGLEALGLPSADRVRRALSIAG